MAQYGHNLLVFIEKENLKKNFDDLETFVLKIDNVKSKNVIVNLVYTPPNRSIKTFYETFHKTFKTFQIKIINKCIK